jgi:hypothetical protein
MTNSPSSDTSTWISEWDAHIRKSLGAVFTREQVQALVESLNAKARLDLEAIDRAVARIAKAGPLAAQQQAPPAEDA